jgi:hypothetical protein
LEKKERTFFGSLLNIKKKLFIKGEMVMSFNMNLWKVDNSELKGLSKSKLENENRLENWIAQDITIIDLDILLIGGR